MTRDLQYLKVNEEAKGWVGSREKKMQEDNEEGSIVVVVGNLPQCCRL